MREKLAALDEGINEIAVVKSRIDELSKELSAGTGTIREDITALENGIGEITTVKGRLEELSKEIKFC